MSDLAGRHSALIAYCTEAAFCADPAVYSRAVLEGCSQLSGLAWEERKLVQLETKARATRRASAEPACVGPALLRLEGIFLAWQHFHLAQAAR